MVLVCSASLRTSCKPGEPGYEALGVSLWCRGRRPAVDENPVLVCSASLRTNRNPGRYCYKSMGVSL